VAGPYFQMDLEVIRYNSRFVINGVLCFQWFLPDSLVLPKVKFLKAKFVFFSRYTNLCRIL